MLRNLSKWLENYYTRLHNLQPSRNLQSRKDKHVKTFHFPPSNSPTKDIKAKSCNNSDTIDTKHLTTPAAGVRLRGANDFGNIALFLTFIAPFFSLILTCTQANFINYKIMTALCVTVWLDCANMPCNCNRDSDSQNHRHAKNNNNNNNVLNKSFCSLLETF